MRSTQIQEPKKSSWTISNYNKILLQDNMARILAFGDSFVLGDQDDFGKPSNYHPDFPPTHGMTYPERKEYLKYNVSFVSLIAKHLNVDIVNCSERGASNYQQLDQLMSLVHNGSLASGDVILFGFTTIGRDRISVAARNKDTRTNLINDNLIESGEWDSIEYFDFFYILSVLDSLANTYQVPIIKFNLFDNLLNKNIKTGIKFPSKDFIGFELENNLLIDILDDTWGSDTKRARLYHTELTPDTEHQKYYTWNRHPSILGHEKIADWFLNNINWKDYIK